MCIDMAQEQLTEDIIKELHHILKQSTKASWLAWFAVGDHKKRANMVGGREAAKPKEITPRMKVLFSEYEVKAAVTINDIIRFHYAFERIHPFQDDNGRVDRLIALKECLRFGLIPFIIEDTKKLYYYQGLSEWEKGYLTDTCLDGQDTFRKPMSMFDIQS